MISCDTTRDSLHRYIDGELSPVEQLLIEAHLLDCTACIGEYKLLRRVVDTVRGSQPLYPTPPALRAKVSRILDSASSVKGARTSFRAAIVFSAFAATVVICTLLPGFHTHKFTSFAAETHLKYSAGAIPLDVSSDDSSVVSSWLSSHAAFALTLPDFPPAPDEPGSYSLVGARLLRFEGADALYLAYTMHHRPISLLVASNVSVLPDKYESYKSGRLIFHFSSESGLKLISWKDHGLSYALVSDLEEALAQSCIICHGSQSERRKIDNLLRLDRRAD